MTGKPGFLPQNEQ